MDRGTLHLSILGGGPAGLAASYFAQKKGVPFALIEGSSELGGLCRTLRCGGHSYDTGAHRFHDRCPDVTRELRRLLGDDLSPVTSPSKVSVSGRFLDFPPTPINALRSSKPADLARSLADLIRSRLRKRPQKSFADFAVNAFGETLARKFLLNYSEKVWGLPAEQLSPDIATRRLSGMNMGTLLLELFFPGRKTAHIDGHFLYPKGGYGQICRALEASLPAEAIHSRHVVTGLECRDDRITGLRFGNGRSHDVPGSVLSTLPLTLTVQLLGPRLPRDVHAACGRLRFRNIRLIFLRLDQPRVSDNATIYLPDRRFCVSRVHEPRNRSASMARSGETSLVAEIPCFDGDAIARLTPQKLFERVGGEVEEIGLTQQSKIIEWRHNLLRNAYPVYSLDYFSQVSTIQRALGKFQNLHLLGRNGRFFYSHLHDQMRLARELVNSLTGSAGRPDETVQPEG